MRIGGLIERESAGHVYFKWSLLNQTIEFGDRFRAGISIVARHAYSSMGLGFGFNAIGIRNASALTKHLERLLSLLATSGNEGGVQTIWRKLKNGSGHIILMSIRHCISAQAPHQRHAIIP